MLKKSLLAVLALAAMLNARAKSDISMEWGVTAGARYSFLSPEGSSGGLSVQPGIGFDAGIHSSIVFTGVAIQPELNYAFTKLRISTGPKGVSADIKGHDLEIPILVSLRLLPVVRFNAGPVFTIMSSARYAVRDESLQLGGLRPTFGYSAGISVRVLKKMLIDARYTGYFNRTVNEFNPSVAADGQYTFRLRNGWVGLKIGYIF